MRARWTDRRSDLLQEPLAGEATRRGEAGEQPLVLGQELGGLADADLGRHAQQLGAVDRAGQADQQRQGDATRARSASQAANTLGSNVRLLTMCVA